MINEHYHQNNVMLLQLWSIINANIIALYLMISLEVSSGEKMKGAIKLCSPLESFFSYKPKRNAVSIHREDLQGHSK